jgi:hypothetical protein
LLKRLAALSCAALLSACASPVVRAPAVSQHEWSDSRRALAELRHRVPQKPFVEIVHVSMREPNTGRVLQARGAVAIDPHHAMRLVLLGPGGATALDVWVTEDEWRYAVPALNVVRHSKPGDFSADSAAGFPIEFFRWWFLEPLDGRLLFAERVRDDKDPILFRTFVLANGESTVTLKALYGPRRRAFLATRRDMRNRNVDHLIWGAHGFMPGPGETATYTQAKSGFVVEIGVEEMSPDAPDQTAFIDPDAKGGASL